MRLGCPFPGPCLCGADPPVFDDGLAVVERHAVRVVLRDATGAVLAFRARELSLPALGFWWELPGGGLEPGEDHRQAAVRELAEETGIALSTEEVGPPAWRRSVTYRSRGRRRLQHEVVAVATVKGIRPRLDTSNQLRHEIEDYLGYRWFPVAALAADPGRFFPARLPLVLPRLLAGERIAEPLEHWS